MAIKKTDAFAEGRLAMESALEVMKARTFSSKIEGQGNTYNEVARIYETIQRLQNELIPFLSKITEQIKTIENNLDEQDKKISASISEYYPEVREQ